MLAWSLQHRGGGGGVFRASHQTTPAFSKVQTHPLSEALLVAAKEQRGELGDHLGPHMCKGLIRVALGIVLDHCELQQDPLAWLGLTPARAAAGCS